MPLMDRDVGMGTAGADDLPRTLRREREARERAHQSAYTGNGGVSMASFAPDSILAEPTFAPPATVTDIRIPFTRMVVFCLKLVLSAVPALLLLGCLLWLAGHLLMTYFPWLVKVQILIRVPS